MLFSRLSSPTKPADSHTRASGAPQGDYVKESRLYFSEDDRVDIDNSRLILMESNRPNAGSSSEGTDESQPLEHPVEAGTDDAKNRGVSEREGDVELQPAVQSTSGLAPDRGAGSNASPGHGLPCHNTPSGDHAPTSPHSELAEAGQEAEQEMARMLENTREGWSQCRIRVHGSQSHRRGQPAAGKARRSIDYDGAISNVGAGV